MPRVHAVLLLLALASVGCGGGGSQVAAAEPIEDAEGMVSLPESEKACCVTLEAFYSANMDQMGEWETRGDCCPMLGWGQEGTGLACTPWGPPTPPAFTPRANA